MSTQANWLLALNRVQPNMYGGTVTHEEIQRRRNKNRRRRAAQRTARLIAERKRNHR